MLSLIVVIVLYFALFYAAYYKKIGLFAGILILLCSLYDFLFIEIGYILPSSVTIILKPFQEIIILIGCFLILLRKESITIIKISFKERLILFCVFIPFVISIISSIANGFDMGVMITGFRCFFVPILCAYIITYKRGINISPKVFEIITILFVSFAAYQVVTFSGNLSDLWVYDSLNDGYGENEMDKAFYNYKKDDTLRAISFFVTPIDFSISSAACALFFISRMQYGHRLENIFFFLLSIIGVLLSQTRIGMFALFLGIATIFYLRHTVKAKKAIIIIIPIIMILVTLFFIFMVGDLDLSALGRLTQYAEFGQSFSLLGRGLGDQSGVFDYDSFVLCCMNLFGLTGILYLSFFIFLFSKAIDIYNECYQNSMTVFTVSLSSSMLYVFGFHHIAGSFVYWLVILLLFNMISMKKSKQQRFSCNSNLSKSMVL